MVSTRAQMDSMILRSCSSVRQKETDVMYSCTELNSHWMENGPSLVLSFDWGSGGLCIVVLTAFCCTRLPWLSAPADLHLFEINTRQMMFTLLFSVEIKSIIVFMKEQGQLWVISGKLWWTEGTNLVCDGGEISSGVGEGGIKSRSFSESELTTSISFGSVHFFLFSAGWKVEIVVC